jgi:hypothetical protein
MTSRNAAMMTSTEAALFKHLFAPTSKARWKPRQADLFAMVVATAALAGELGRFIPNNAGRFLAGSSPALGSCLFSQWKGQSQGTTSR